MKKFYEEVNEYRYMEIAVTLVGFQKKLRTHTHEDEGEHTHEGGTHSQESGSGYHTHDGGKHTHYLEQYWYMDTDVQLQCHIPILMTDIGGGDPISFPVIKGVSNIMSKDYSPYTIFRTGVNYVTLNVPSYIAESLPHDEKGFVKKGKSLIITFISGDINNIKVIGRI